MDIETGGDGDEKLTWKQSMIWIYTVVEAHGLFLRQRTVSVTGLTGIAPTRLK